MNGAQSVKDAGREKCDEVGASGLMRDKLDETTHPQKPYVRTIPEVEGVEFIYWSYEFEHSPNGSGDSRGSQVSAREWAMGPGD
jgi:hypothetical protein